MPQSLGTTLAKLSRIKNAVNAGLISEYHQYMVDNQTSESYQATNVKCLTYFATWLEDHVGLDVSFYNIETKEPFIGFLKTKIKSKEQDPDERWITSYNHYLGRIKIFFRWLYNVKLSKSDKDILPVEMWKTPDFLHIPKKKTKRVSPYSADQIWEHSELLTVVKYEPNLRNKAALMLMWDLNARPGEAILLELRNIKMKDTYAEGEIPFRGKTGSGPILLYASFPYVRDWINAHPMKNNPRARLLCDLRTGKALKPTYLWSMTQTLRLHIESLLKEGAINDEKDREMLEHLLRTKKWNPYCLRHSSITADSDYLPGYALNKKVRWTMNSKQPARYIKNRMGNALKNQILTHHGIISEETKIKPSVLMCPKCKDPNKPENRYCSKCSYPLTIEAYDEIKLKEKQREVKLTEMYDLLQEEGVLADLKNLAARRAQKERDTSSEKNRLASI